MGGAERRTGYIIVGRSNEPSWVVDQGGVSGGLMNFPSKGIPPRCVAHLSTDTRTNKTLTSEWMLESINPLLGESSSQNLSVFGHRGWSQDFNPEI